MKKIFYFILFISLLPAQDKVGTSAANFLGITMGSKASSLGGSVSSLKSDASSFFYNPASISISKKNQFSLNNTDWFLDSKILFFAGNYKINNSATIGAYIINLNYGKEEITDFENQNGSDLYWTANDLAIASGLSLKLTNQFSIGSSIKFISQRIHNESATSLATDIGIMYSSEPQKFNMGFSISNFGLNMMLEGKDLYNRIDLDPQDGGNNETIVAKIKTESWPLPLFLRLGISKTVNIGKNNAFLITNDFVIPSDDAEIICTGIDINSFEILSIRFGHNTTLNDYDDEYFTFGFGLKTQIRKFPINIDYSYQNRRLLNQTSVIGISFEF